MKNRKVSSNDNIILTKTVTDTSKSQSDIRPRRKSAGNSFLKKSAEILQSYRVIFSKPTPYNIGDADTFFRQSLRNYNDGEVSHPVKWGQKLNSEKSLESLGSHKKRVHSAPRFGQGDTQPIHREKKKQVQQFERQIRITEKRTSLDTIRSGGEQQNKLLVEVFEEEEPEVDIFYSPSSQADEQNNTEQSTFASNKERFHLPDPPEATENFAVDLQDITEKADDSSDKDSTMAEDDLQAVESLVQQAGSALSEVVAENPSLQETMETGPEDSGANETMASEDLATSEVKSAEKEDNGETTEATESEKLVTDSEDDGSTVVTGTTSGQDSDIKTTINYDPNIDVAVIRELEDAERQAMETAKIIYELKQRVAQLLSKSKMTEVEARELEEKNKQLREQMSLFETKTKRIQFLVDQANLFENMMSPRPPLPDKKHNEDMLPKVIICGMTENNMPKIIVCDDKKKKSSSGQKKTSYSLPPPVNVMPQFAKRLSESYYMQERLAAENADLEGKRYKLQEDLLDKDQTVESLQRRLNSLQGEMRMVCKENSLLSEKLERVEACTSPCSKGDYEGNSAYQAPCKKHPNKQKMPCGKNKGPCPADVESRLQEYSETTQQLEKQLSDMEGEVRNMQTELVAVQKERQHLEQHRRMLCPPPCAPPPCAPPPCPKPPCPGPCNPARKSGGSPDQQLRELREQYNRLQDDYKSKLTEVAGLRADTEKLKQTAKESEEAKKIAEDKVKEFEKEMKNHKTEKNKFMGSKEQLVEQEQQLNVAKQRFREAQDELEELRALIQDQQAQLDDYRNKYLQAQQQVEEQRRQIDMMEMENNRISEQVNLEIQRVKNQFQEKLQELTPLPDILKATQLKLQEAQQMHLLAERNNEALVHELTAYRDKASAMADQMEKVRSDQQLGADEKATMAQRAEEYERKFGEAQEENDRLKQELARMEEIAEQNEKRVQEKLHEIAQLVSQLETVREESARQVARTKDRCETVRRSMQNQIADLERQLAQSRAQARSAQKDRDDIRQKMQSQINNLNENFEDAQMRIRNLQGHVNFLKNSYTTVFPPNEGMVSDGMDACDCGNNY